MRFEGLKEGGLYKILGGPNGMIATFADPNAFSFRIIPNDAVVMFLRRLESNNGLVLYEDKTYEINIETGGYLRPVAI
jgi:hypothetical protein